jgi:hypothetical protein
MGRFGKALAAALAFLKLVFVGVAPAQAQDRFAILKAVAADIESSRPTFPNSASFHPRRIYVPSRQPSATRFALTRRNVRAAGPGACRIPMPMESGSISISTTPALRRSSTPNP